MSQENSKILVSSDLRSYFFDELSELNSKSICPIPQATLFYSSVVLNKFLLSEAYFEISEGKVREKVLGMRLLEAGSLSFENQKRVYQEIGDTALLICGYFSESVNKKLLDISYYKQLGMTAYSHLDGHVPRFLDITGFYKTLASSFLPLTTLLTMLASKDRFGDEKHLLFKKVMQEEASEYDYLASGIISSDKKVS